MQLSWNKLYSNNYYYYYYIETLKPCKSYKVIQSQIAYFIVYEFVY